MSQFRRKDQEDFEITDLSTASGSGNAVSPDFSALEPQSGFSAGELEREPVEAAAAPEPIPPKSGSSVKPAESARVLPSPAEETPGKKRYYSPNEVMRKKGCIGCGGMVLAVPFLVTVIGIVIAIL